MLYCSNTSTIHTGTSGGTGTPVGGRGVPTSGASVLQSSTLTQAFTPAHGITPTTSKQIIGMSIFGLYVFENVLSCDEVRPNLIMFGFTDPIFALPPNNLNHVHM